MKKLTEEEFPDIKEAFEFTGEVDKDEARKWIVNAEAEGTRPAVTRTGVVEQVVGENGDRIVIVNYYDIYIYILEEELLENMKKLESSKIVKKKISFKLIGKHDGKYIASCKEIQESYKVSMFHAKILKGKIIEIKKGKTKYGDYAIVLSKGDKIIIPASEFAIPNFLSLEEKVGHIIEFAIVEVKDDKIIGSTKIATDYRNEQLKSFYDKGETFKAEVEKTAAFGAFLTYKHNNGLVLRNKDFASDYTNCKDVLEKGDIVNVRIKNISQTSGKFIVEMVNKYHIEPKIKLEDIEVDQEFDGEVVDVQPFGAFVRISPGRDVLCPVNTDKREPVIGNQVTIKVIVSNAERQKLRGQIVKYNDNLLDLSKYNLI